MRTPVLLEVRRKIFRECLEIEAPMAGESRRRMYGAVSAPSRLGSLGERRELTFGEQGRGCWPFPTQNCGCLLSNTTSTSPAALHHRPLPGTHDVYAQEDGQAELTWMADCILRSIFQHQELNTDVSPIPVLTVRVADGVFFKNYEKCRPILFT